MFSPPFGMGMMEDYASFDPALAQKDKKE